VIWVPRAWGRGLSVSMDGSLQTESGPGMTYYSGGVPYYVWVSLSDTPVYTSLP
jgi:hypothetical protein